MDTQASSGAEVDENPNKGLPAYRGGHFDTTLEDFPLLIDLGRFKTGWLVLGDAEDGPALATITLGPGVPADPPHFHNSAQVRIVLKGSFRIGKDWYHEGDVRIQQAGVPYGPEEVGPEGCTQLLFFADRRGMFPHYRPEIAERHPMGLSLMKALMAITDVEPT